MGMNAKSGALGFVLVSLAGCGVSPPLEKEAAKSEAALTLACGEPAVGIYDAYPGPDTDYAVGPATTAHLASALNWPGERFEGYSAGSNIECQSNPSAVGAWDVITANQCLKAAVDNGNGVGSIETDTLRVLATGSSAGKRVGWTDQTVQLRAKINSFSNGSSAASGVRVVARFQTENDFYVASLRKDGYVRLEKRCGGSYSQLVTGVFYEVPLATTWYTLKLSASSSGDLSFTVSGGATQVTLTGHDTTLPWGTAGFRADGVRAYVDDWYIARDVRTPSALTQAALQTELNGLVDGGILLVPAGTYAGTQTLSVKGDDVAVLGAGSSASVIQRDTDGTTTPLLQATNHARTRIAGLGFAGYGAASSNGKETGIELNDVTDFRVDHAAFTRLGNAGVKTNGASRGVVDHSDFNDMYKTTVGTLGYGVVVYGTNSSLPADQRPYGTADATFVEDSTFQKCRHAVSSNQGARYVFRHNAVSLNGPDHPIDTHGQEYPDYPANVGTEWADIYDNTVTGVAGDYLGYAIRLRGGRGVIHDNQITGFTVAVRLTQDTTETTGPINIFSPIPSSTFKVNATNTQGSPIVVQNSAPAGYTSQPYPHPLAQ